MPLGGLHHGCGQAEYSHFRILPASGVDRDAFSVGERLGNNFKFFAIEPDMARCGVAKMFNAGADFGKGRVTRAGLREAHDCSIIRPAAGQDFAVESEGE